MTHELRKRGFDVQAEAVLPVVYHGIIVDLGYKLDLLVNNTVILELKSVQAIGPVHRAQLMMYLKLSNKEIGLLVNFNVAHLRDGIHRIVNNYHPSASPASPAVKFLSY